MNRPNHVRVVALTCENGGTTKDGPDGAGNTATRAYPRCIRRFHMITPPRADSPQGAA